MSVLPSCFLHFLPPFQPMDTAASSSRPRSTRGSPLSSESECFLHLLVLLLLLDVGNLEQVRERERGREGRREGEREGGREGGRERGREGE